MKGKGSGPSFPTNRRAFLRGGRAVTQLTGTMGFVELPPSGVAPGLPGALPDEASDDTDTRPVPR